MKEILERALKNRKIISLCKGEVDWERRIIGYVKKVGLKYAIIEEVDMYGCAINRQTILIEKIVVVEMNDSYNSHLETLRMKCKSIKKMKHKYYYNKSYNFYKRLEHLCYTGEVCTIFFETEYLTGILVRVQSNYLIVNSVGYRGTYEGESFCKIECISKIRHKGPFEAKISFLLKNNV